MLSTLLLLRKFRRSQTCCRAGRCCTQGPQRAEGCCHRCSSSGRRMTRSIVDVIDCAQYVCCNNSAYGAGGVGISVHNTNALIGHRNAVQNAGNSLFTSTATFVFANSRRPPHLPAVLLRPFRAPRCVSITPTHSRGRRCYCASVLPTLVQAQAHPHAA